MPVVPEIAIERVVGSVNKMKRDMALRHMAYYEFRAQNQCAFKPQARHEAWLAGLLRAPVTVIDASGISLQSSFTFSFASSQLQCL